MNKHIKIAMFLSIAILGTQLSASEQNESGKPKITEEEYNAMEKKHRKEIFELTTPLRERQKKEQDNFKKEIDELTAPLRKRQQDVWSDGNKEINAIVAPLKECQQKNRDDVNKEIHELVAPLRERQKEEWDEVKKQKQMPEMVKNQYTGELRPLFKESNRRFLNLPPNYRCGS